MNKKARQREYLREYRKRTGNAVTHRYERTKKGKLMRIYRNMRSRVEGVQKQKHHLYDGKPLVSRDAFYEWAMRPDSGFHELYDNWVSSEYDRALAPTVDRIDPERGYSFDNMEWVTHSENSRRGGYWRPSEHGLTQYGERLA